MPKRDTENPMNKEQQYEVAKYYFENGHRKATFRSVAEKFNISISRASKYYKKWVNDMYTDFMREIPCELLCEKYEVNMGQLLKALHEAERYKGIGLCQSRIKLKDGRLTIQ